MATPLLWGLLCSRPNAPPCLPTNTQKTQHKIATTVSLPPEITVGGKGGGVDVRRRVDLQLLAIEHLLLKILPSGLPLGLSERLRALAIPTAKTRGDQIGETARLEELRQRAEIMP